MAKLNKKYTVSTYQVNHYGRGRWVLWSYADTMEECESYMADVKQRGYDFPVRITDRETKKVIFNTK